MCAVECALFDDKIDEGNTSGPTGEKVIVVSLEAVCLTE